jgi:hypothetical protein
MSTERTKPPGPKQVMTLLDEADKTINASILKGGGKQSVLRDSYEYLCEYAHPNFHSNNVSYEIDKTIDEMRFKYGEKMTDYNCELLRYLIISNTMFCILFGDLPKHLPSKKPEFS